MSSPSLNLRLRADAAYARHEGQSERASLMEEAADALSSLWCCHVRGPDDVYAAPDYDTALKWSDIINEVNWRGLKGAVNPPKSWDECLCKAAPAIWPWSAEDHAKNMTKSIADFEPRPRPLSSTE